MERLERDPKGLTELTIAEYAELGGMEGAEVIMWLIMRAAVSKRARCMHKSYYLPSMTGIASMIFEEPSKEKGDDEEKFRSYLQRIDRQLAGIENLEGTYPFTIARSVRAFRLNDFLHRLIEPDFREHFRTDPETSYAEADLTPEEREMLRGLDWRAMLRYGVSFFMLEKLGAVVGTSNMHIYAAMRNESLEDLLKTRNASLLYSVAGDVGAGTSFKNNN
jgi:gallate dioxygenase